MLERGFFINNRYEILSRVGAGGMSDVYKAKDHKLNRNVAIKVLKKNLARIKILCPNLGLKHSQRQALFILIL